MKLYSLSDLCRKAGIPMYSAPNVEKMYGVKPRSRSGRAVFYSLKDIRAVRLAARPKGTRLHPAKAEPLIKDKQADILIAALTDLRVSIDQLTHILKQEPITQDPPADQAKT